MQPSMGFCEAIKICMGKKFANFSDRARRSEFWFFQLFLAIVEFFLQFLSSMFMNARSGQMAEGAAIILLIFLLIILIPSLAVTVRRLHDIGKSGWYILIGLIPILGFFILLYFMCIDSEVVPNEYGPSPKYNSSVQTNSQNLIDQNNPVYQNNPTPLNAYPQQQTPTYQQPYQNPVPQQPYQNPVPQQPYQNPVPPESYQNPVPQQPYQSPVPPESYQSHPQQPYQNPVPQQPYQSPVPPESYQSHPQQSYQNPVPQDPNQIGFNQQYPPNPAPPEGFDKI
jgi:uncharacterized membrane protein YhaH (DUF805 family)